MSHAEALRQNALQRQQLAEQVARHTGHTNTNTGPTINFKEPIDSELSVFAPPRPQVTKQRSRPQVQVPQVAQVQQSRPPQPNIPREKSHEEALQRNALHRQQLAEVVSLHTGKVQEVAEKLNIPKEAVILKESKSQTKTKTKSEPAFKPRNDLEKFLAQEESSDRSFAKSSSASVVKSSSRPVDISVQEEDRDLSNYAEELREHLELISLLDTQVAELFNDAREIFAEEKKVEKPIRSGGKLKGKKKGSKRKQDADDAPRRRPTKADPRQREEE